MKTLTLCALSAIARTEQGAANASRSAKEATANAAQSVNDATITAAVNADLAKDSELSALRINVDTRDGRVTLNGTAPNADAKQRAERLALAEKGVVGVDNKLAIKP